MIFSVSGNNKDIELRAAQPGNLLNRIHIVEELIQQHAKTAPRFSSGLPSYIIILFYTNPLLVELCPRRDVRIQPSGD